MSFLCRRDGTWDSQYKLHITPDEVEYWGLHGGRGLKVFQTDIGKIGILVCYDIEFPELARILADQGMQILLITHRPEEVPEGFFHLLRVENDRVDALA